MLATAIAAQTAPPADASVRLPRGTVVVLRNVEPLTSKTVKQGDVIRFRVVKPILVDGVTVISAGATASARVTGAMAAQRKGVGGRLELTFESVELVTGTAAPIEAVQSQQAGGKREMAANMVRAGILTAGLASPLFLMQKGSEVEIRRGERFEAATASEIALGRGELLAHQPSPMQPRADAATIYFIKAPPPAGQYEIEAPWPFSIGEAWFHLARNSTLKIEVPPGKYWVHTLYKPLRKVKPEDRIAVDAAAGSEYFFEYAFGEKKLILKPLTPDAARTLMENSEVYAEIRLEEHPKRQLKEMAAQVK